MIAKISAWAPDRPSALARLAGALSETEVAGVVTNLSFLRALAAHPEVALGRTVTRLIEHEIAPAWREARKKRALAPAALAACAIAAFEGMAATAVGAAGGASANGAGGADGAAGAGASGPWDRLAGFRLGAESESDR
jgi:acetyl/propionyl-CoA carboxylase alpha subunit